MKLNKYLYKGYRQYPERILQFGEGNFLRAFADWIIHRMNEEIDFNSGILVVGPRKNDKVYRLNDQDGLYTLLLKGYERKKLVEDRIVINCITRGIHTYKDYEEYLKAAENPKLRFIISNTTEAGIVYDENDRLEDRPQESFPGKVTAFLYHRYKYFNGNESKGLIFLPCELIENNGNELKNIILRLAREWKLEKEFIQWVEKYNVFCNTLVDRIVPGYPKENADEIQKELGYEDDFLVEGEHFHLWAIEGNDEVKKEFPADKIGLNVVFVDDLTPYRVRKVRILNGMHTIMVPVSYLYGFETVKESIEDELIGEYIKSTVFEEIIPSIDYPKNESENFAYDVFDRFRNPFIKHYLMSISLNSMSKFETRVLPSILGYIENEKKLPTKLLFSFAALIKFYKGERDGQKINLSDNHKYLELYSKLWSNYDGSEKYLDYIVETILGLKELWKLDLNEIEGLKDLVTEYLICMEKKGMKAALKEML